MAETETHSLDDITFTAAELVGIEEAVAQANAGMLIDFDDVMAWLHSLDTHNSCQGREPPVRVEVAGRLG